jgi:3-oxoacyl-[acyl-carrier protein] reductase/meso-butanediol dehydrogenase/(S,S)-butanediol dehydrogenase/diacetyl reductase
MQAASPLPSASPLPPAGRLDGVVIVTGSSAMKSIGRATALLAADMGADVVVSDLQRPLERVGDDERQAGWRGLETLADQIADRGRRCLPVYCDITKRHEVQVLVDRAAGLGPVVGLVNAARAFVRSERCDLADTGDEDWDWTMAVNVRGPLTCSAIAARAMMAGGRAGSVVNVSSIRGSHPLPGSGAYSVSKAALNMLTRVMALELAPQGIRVNAVCPGTVATNRVRLGEQQAAAAAGVDPDEYRRSWLETRAAEVPLGRVAQPGDIASAVAFLLSPASSYITGECLQVSGGRAAL